MIKFHNASVVGSPLAQTNQETVSPALEVNGAEIKADFDYLDKGDVIGATVYTQQAARETATATVSVSGRVKGMAGGIKKRDNEDIFSPSDFLFNPVLAIMAAFGSYWAAHHFLMIGQTLDLWNFVGEVDPDMIPTKVWLKWVSMVGLGVLGIVSTLLAIFVLVWVASVMLFRVPSFVKKNLT